VAALDLGRARVGLAVSDELWMLAHARPPLPGGDRKALLARLAELTREEGIVRFVVGLPLRLGGERGVAARRAAQFCRDLARASGVEVELLDERWTTVQAERELREAGLRGEALRAELDGRAAAILLQQWLDSQPPNERGLDAGSLPPKGRPKGGGSGRGAP
jgi:putative Holliday junction resolvase